MLFWVIQTTVLSLLFIFLIHHLFTFFKNTLTTPKVKDFVHIPTEKYDAIYTVLQNKNNNVTKEPPINIDLSSLLPKPDEPVSMKDELKNFLKKQRNQNTPIPMGSQEPNSYFSSTSIDSLSTF
jgi:hypothetical protein